MTARDMGEGDGRDDRRTGAREPAGAGAEPAPRFGLAVPAADRAAVLRVYLGPEEVDAVPPFEGWVAHGR